jgi:endonuclease/exonuclease/phosphatase family metal-dependent hydrolase
MELCLISCNIRFDNPADGQNSWPFRRSYLAQTLLKHNPALIATQEGRFHQLNELKTSLQHFEIIDQHRSWIGERMYPTFFIQPTAFEYLVSGDLWLSETPDVAGSKSFESTFPRLMTWTKLQPKESEKNILVINTHLDHIKAETRQEQVKVLCQEVKRIWDKQSALIIMGDFNDAPESKVREIIQQEFDLQDAWKLFNSVEESSHHSFQREVQNGSRIDWILVDKRITVTSCVMDKCTKEGIYPTDHYPIVCKIKF